MANPQLNIRLLPGLSEDLSDFCNASGRRRGDVMRQCVRMLLAGGHGAAEDRLNAAVTGREEWPAPETDG